MLPSTPLSAFLRAGVREKGAFLEAARKHPSQGREPSCKLRSGSSLAWLLLGPAVPLVSGQQPGWGAELQAGPPWRSAHGILPPHPPPQTSCHHRAGQASCFPSLESPLVHTLSPAAQGQPGGWDTVSHTQIGHNSNSQARQGEVQRLRPHPPGEIQHESVSREGTMSPLEIPSVRYF